MHRDVFRLGSRHDDHAVAVGHDHISTCHRCWNFSPVGYACREIRYAVTRGAANCRSVFKRSWPHAASMSWPFSRRSVAVTWQRSNA
jgi:hypothetical protein